LGDSRYFWIADHYFRGTTEIKEVHPQCDNTKGGTRCGGTRCGDHATCDKKLWTTFPQFHEKVFEMQQRYRKQA